MQGLIRRFQQFTQVTHPVMDRLAPLIEQHKIITTAQGTYQLRLATIEDVDAFVALEDDAYKGFRAWTREDFAQDWRRNPYSVYLLAQDQANGQVVGMVSGRFLAKGAHISHLLVATDWQGQGIGSWLLDAWIHFVQLEGIHIITLEVRASNKIAQQLYRNRGFVRVKELERYYRDNLENAWLMKRQGE